MRITHKMVEIQFERLCAVLGTDWELSYVKEYGGFEIQAKDGTACPFFYCDRKGASEMYACIIFALRAIQIDRAGDDCHEFWPRDKKEVRSC